MSLGVRRTVDVTPLPASQPYLSAVATRPCMHRNFFLDSELCTTLIAYLVTCLFGGLVDGGRLV